LIRIEVKYFAAARERAGLEGEPVALAPGSTVAALLDHLIGLHPALIPLVPGLRVAVNRAFAELGDLIPDHAEVALIPPVAGGVDLPRVLLTAAPLSLDAAVQAVSGPGRGGVVTFTGMVRDHSRGRAVLRLEYEAYAAMAEPALAQICAQAHARFDAQVAIHHRVGTLTVGEVAVVIAAAAAHRAPAFDACRFAIEALKRDVPIWKKELTADGEHWVGLGP